VTRTAGGTLLFTDSGVTLLLAPHRPNTQGGTAHPAEATAQDSTLATHLRFLGASSPLEVRPDVVAAAKVNYLLGDDPAAWHTGLPTYSGVTYPALYDGIDLSYRGDKGQLKGTYIVQPGTDPGSIRWSYEGARAICIDSSGNLQIEIAEGARSATITEQAPVAWQETDAGRTPIAIRYELLAGGNIGFHIGSYDPSRLLTIDPTLTYSTYFGGNLTEVAEDIAVDMVGSAYITGFSTSANMPTQAPIQGNPPAPKSYRSDAFVLKLNPAGNEIVYATYLGGSEYDSAYGIAVDASGNAYVTGSTMSVDFPTKDPIQKATRGKQDDYKDVFVAELNPTGSGFVYSTYLGSYGDERAYGIAVDKAGSAYITGATMSSDYMTKNPIQPHNFGYIDTFVTKLNPGGKGLAYSTFLGGKESDEGMRIAVDDAGNAYIGGVTWSDNYPTKNAYQSQNVGEMDLFISKINPQGTALVYSTYLGGSGEEGLGFHGRMFGLAVDRVGNAYITSWTKSPDFPTKNAIQPHMNGANGDTGFADAFVTELDRSGASLVYSTFLGGSNLDYGVGIAVDDAGNAFVTGQTGSGDFPVPAGTQPVRNKDYDAFLVEIKAGGLALLYSSLLGGTGVDTGQSVAVRAGSAYVVGRTTSLDFPVTKDAIQDFHHGAVDDDAFVVRISGMPDSPTSMPPSAPLPATTALPGGGSRTFSETGKKVTGLFLDYWNKNGGLAQQGYPISNVIGELSQLDGKPYTVQYFERAVFEYHPEKPAPYNVLLSQVGTFQYAKKYPGGAPGQQPNKTGGMYFAETEHWLGGSFLKYWQEHGGLAQQGYPVSDEFIETSELDGKQYRVQYFERAVLEMHPEKQLPYDVLLSQLGTFSYKARYGSK
jgi:hypothetical protein